MDFGILGIPENFSIAHTDPLLHVALLALHTTAPLKFTVTPLGPPFDYLAMTTPTTEGGAAVTGRGVPVALTTHSAWREITKYITIREIITKYFII